MLGCAIARLQLDHAAERFERRLRPWRWRDPVERRGPPQSGAGADQHDRLAVKPLIRPCEPTESRERRRRGWLDADAGTAEDRLGLAKLLVGDLDRLPVGPLNRPQRMISGMAVYDRKGNGRRRRHGGDLRETVAVGVDERRAGGGLADDDAGYRR